MFKVFARFLLDARKKGQHKSSGKGPNILAQSKKMSSKEVENGRLDMCRMSVRTGFNMHNLL